MLPNLHVMRPVYPKPRERGIGSEGEDDRHILNFDNRVSIWVR
jgi:hypothetical protein